MRRLSIENALAEELRAHQGLNELNQLRRQREMEKTIDDDAAREAFSSCSSPTPHCKAYLRQATDSLPLPAPEGSPFVGKRFPSFFQLTKEPKGGLLKGLSYQPDLPH